MSLSDDIQLYARNSELLTRLQRQNDAWLTEVGIGDPKELLHQLCSSLDDGEFLKELNKKIDTSLSHSAYPSPEPSEHEYGPTSADTLTQTSSLVLEVNCLRSEKK